MAAVAVALPLHAAAQTTDTAAILKRLDALEANERAIAKQLDEIKALLATRPAQPAPAADAALGAEISLANTAVKGESGSKFVLVEFSDFQCPFCGRYVRDTYGALQKEFVDSGRLRYAFKNLPLENIHPFAFKAAEAGECARQQGKFWEMHDRLFANQQALAQPDLEQSAHAIGLDGGKFQSCLDGKTASLVRDDIAEASRLGVSSTPTFFVGQMQPDGRMKIVRKIVGAQPYASFKAALQGVLAAPTAAK